MTSLRNSTGGCICGHVRYRIDADPIALFACHCSDCQTVTGAGYVLALRVPHCAPTVTAGEVKAYPREEADRRQRIIHRCPQCLTVLWSERPDTQDYVTIYAGTLDESPRLRPVAHIWTRDAQPWMTLSPDALQFAENPPDMQPILDAWQRQQIAS